ncbi:BRCT [Glarea lozoyensis ATCC 20868]|uniref:BRCT n=2 Tax=Glarea lozoyensis TaxID=101852 RepID=S3DDN2_GLAL2|nr:BRCT [Glarea lozoyensis ATCC 20868]EHK96576.1 putative Replication factor C subunit 1 [Glarea lozoyensis 74030]EPE30096.1 BRCT [Glarea lozoyensis ATCC 20868]
MPPKKATKAAAASSSIYIVTDSTGIDSVHASVASANNRVSEAKEEGKSSVKVEVQELVGGTVEAAPVEEKKAAPKSKAKAVKTEETDAPKANTAAKKTKPAAEQRAENSKKPAKPADSNLPENIKALLAGSGSTLDGKNVVVTGVPPTLGRKNAEALVQAYGAKLLKSLSKKTDFVVVGNDAGPTKLEKIEELGIKVIDEDELVAMLEGSGLGTKREAEDDEEEEDEEEEEEEEKPTKAKKQKR